MPRATKTRRAALTQRQDRQPAPPMPLDFTPIRAAMRARLLRAARSVVSDLQDGGFTLADIAPQMALRGSGSIGHLMGSRGSLPDAVSLGLLHEFGQKRGSLHLAMLSPVYVISPAPQGDPVGEALAAIRRAVESLAAALAL